MNVLSLFDGMRRNRPATSVKTEKMRTIKFRVWKTDKTTGTKRLIGHERLNEKGVWQRSTIECSIWINGVFDKGFREQSTGLFDKNGKEIYEGDVFTVNGKYPKVVRFISDRACFCIANVDDLNCKFIYPWQIPSFGWWNDFRREIEIIGNEHDNPELLKPE